MTQEIKSLPKPRKPLTRQQKDEANARQREYRQMHPDRWKKYRKKHYEKYKEEYIDIERTYRLKKDFNLTPDEYDNMLQKQSGLCAICYQPETSKNKRGNIKKLAVDHNHETGRLRDLLCARCNQAIGLLDENTDRLRAAAVYLERHNDRN